MLQMKASHQPTIGEAVLVLFGVVGILGLFMIGFETAPQIPLLFTIFALLGYGLLKGVSFQRLEAGMIEGAHTGVGAVYLFFMIGILVSSWLIGGTIPTIMAASMQLISPSLFYLAIFVITGIVGISIGSSLTTVATIGLTFFSIAMLYDLNAAITAGAIVSGAFFGDKMSPLSDTTTIASKTVGVDLFEHIQNMLYTTIPAFVISAIFFWWVSPQAEAMDMTAIDAYRVALEETGLVHGYSWIPLIALFILVILKVPAILSMFISSVLAIALSYLHQSITVQALFGILLNGFQLQSTNEALVSLLSKGGLMSMMFTVSLVLLALSMGGLLFTLGIVQTLLTAIAHRLRSVGSVITGAALTAIGINVTIGEQYLSILLTGQSFAPYFEKNGLAMKNLSRVMEDAGTVINPLVPWSVCGIFIATTLGVPTVDYLPFAIFCLVSPVLTILFGWTGKTLTYQPSKNH